ncbi:hypothetical protein Tco_1457986 [Tanacetum coccineum]
MERKIDEWSKSQNVSSEQTDRTNPPHPPQAHTEHVNAVFTRSGKSDDSSKIQNDPSPPIIINNKIKEDKPIKTTKKDYRVVLVVESNNWLLDLLFSYTFVYESLVSKFSKHNVYSTKAILGVMSVSVKNLHGYGDLEEIVVKRSNQQLYKFKECNCVDLHLNDIEDMLLLAV